MFINYLKVALRNISKHKLFSFINIFGLALSLSFCLLVIVIAEDQSSFDLFHPNPEHVYRVLTIAHRKSGETEPYASSPRPLGVVLRDGSPAVEAVATLTSLRGEVDKNGSSIRVEGFFTEPSFFDVFGFQLAEGNPSTVFSTPNSVVLTTETREKFFGKDEVVGQIVTIKGIGELKVAGVLKPVPGKTHLEFDVLASSAILPLLEKDQKVFPSTSNWNNYYTNYNYVRLQRGHDAEELESLLGSIPKTYYSKIELENRDKGYSFELQRLSGITPGPILSNGLGRGMPEAMLFLLGILAAIGMIAAIFNYTNLTLARSLARAREVGIRKVVGANRLQLCAQFLVEAVVALLLALVAAEAVLRFVLVPSFMGLGLAGELDLDLDISLKIYALFVGFTLVCGVVAGAFPALAISGFRPAMVLKDVSRIQVFSRVTVRRILLGVQFVLSLVLIIVLTTVSRQFEYALKMDYGFARENMVSVNLQGNSYAVVSQKLVQHADVADYSAISHHPGTWEDSSVDVRLTADGEKTATRDYSVDGRFLQNFGLTLLVGTNFKDDSPTLSRSQVIVNQRFVERFGLGAATDAVGKTIILEKDTRVQIVGVLQDFLYKPLTYELEPMMLRYNPESWRVLMVKLHGKDADDAIAYFKDAWKGIDPQHPFSFEFYDDVLRGVYDFFSDLVSIIAFLSFIALTISLLGLLGIVTFNAESRTKEVGVRKVLGATIGQIVFLFARQELSVLAVAAVIAVPISLLIGGKLLESFAYQIGLGVEIVLPGVLLVFGVAGLIVGSLAFRAARANPVESLRYE